MLRTLTVTAAAALALVSTAAFADTYVPYTYGYEKVALSAAALDQGRSSLSVTGSGTKCCTVGPVLLPISDTDFNYSNGDYTPGSTLAAYAAGFELSHIVGGVTKTVEFRNLVASNSANTIYADINVNGQAFAGYAASFTFVNSIFGQSFQGLGRPTIIAFTADSARALNSAFGLTGGNTIRSGTGAGEFSITTPEPAAIAFLGLGVALIGFARRRAA